MRPEGLDMGGVMIKGKWQGDWGTKTLNVWDRNEHETTQGQEYKTKYCLGVCHIVVNVQRECMRWESWC